MPQTQRSASMDQASAHGRGVRQPDRVAAGESEQHPLLSLQQMAGNRAVQRLVGPASNRPAAIQRVLSPATHFYGLAAHAGLTASWSGLSGQMAGLQATAANANVLTQAMAANIGQMLGFISMAQGEPAPPSEYGGESQWRGDRTRSTP